MKAAVLKYKIVHDLSSVVTMSNGFESYVQSIDVTTGDKNFVCNLSDINDHPIVKNILSKKYNFK